MITGKLDQPRPFGRFTLVNKIASGGMATVYRAEVDRDDPLHGKNLALKVLHDHLSENDEFIRMFRDEGRIARDFDHPNVVRVYEIGEVEGAHYLAMDFIEGRDLAQLLVAHRLNHQVMAYGPTFEILRQALMALRYVHAFKGKNGRLQGIVHRDISPQNLLISRQPLVKVTDFGIARGEHRSERTRTGTVKGKMHYMAPEQAAGARVDARADLYALGAVAYEMLTGQPLFGPGTTEVLQARAMHGKIEFGTKFERLTPDLKAWLHKALATHPDDRFHSADAMLAAMELLPKAAPSHYRPEQLVRLLDLPEASRSLQRQQKILGNDASVHTGRIAAGAVLSAASVSRQSQLPPGNHVELDRGSRDSRMRHGEQRVDWNGGVELPVKQTTGVREVPPKEARKASILPAEAASGKNYAVDRKKGADQDVLDPGSFKRPAPAVQAGGVQQTSAGDGTSAGKATTPAGQKATPRAGKGEVKGQAKGAEARTSKVVRLTPEQQGMAVASFVAWSCGALVLFAVLMEVTGVQVKLPEVTDEKLAALFDDDAPKTRTDAVASSKPVAHKPAVPTLRPAGDLAVAGLAPVVAKPVQKPAAPVVHAADPVMKAKAEEAAARVVARNVEREAWADRPLERVAKADDKGPVDPDAAPVRDVAKAPIVPVKVVAKAPVVAKALEPARPAVQSEPGRLGRALPPAARSEQVLVHAGAGVPAGPMAKVVGAKAPVVAAKKPVVAAKAPVVAAKKPVVAAKAPVVAAKKPVVAAKAPVVAAKKPVVAAKAPVVAAKKPVVAAKAPVVAAKKPVVAAKAPVVVAKKPVVAGKAPLARPAPAKAAAPGAKSAGHADAPPHPVARKPEVVDHRAPAAAAGASRKP
jgi:serine/threonine protein kinase